MTNIPTPKRMGDAHRTVKSHATHETVYGLFTKRGKIFYVGRTGAKLEKRLKGHISHNTRQLALGRVANPKLAELVLKPGVYILALTSLIPVADAKLTEDALLKSFKPEANIRGTGRKFKTAKITDEIRSAILNNPHVPCEVLAVRYGIAACTVSVIRHKAKKAKNA